MNMLQTLDSNSRKYNKSKSVLISTKNTTNRLNSRKPGINKKHCPQDVACLHCCQCWLNFQQEYNKRIKYLDNKITELISQNGLLKKCLEKITSQSQKLKKKLKNSTDIQTIKQNIRNQFIEQLDEEIKMKDLLQQQKIKSLAEKLQKSENHAGSLSNQNKQLKQKLTLQKTKLQSITKQQNENKLKFEKEIKQKNQLIQKQSLAIKTLNEQIDSLKQKITTINDVIKQKEKSIGSMKSTIDHSDRLIDRQVSQMASKQSQKHKLQLQFSNKSQQLSKMQKISQQHSKSINILLNEKNKLYSLVDSLKDELIMTQKYNYSLNLALNDAQLIAREKSISLQNLKYDVNMLKYTLT